jgi:transposase-like protein
MNRCPKCNSTVLIKAGKTEKGTQRYQCKMCGRRSAGENTVIRFKNKEEIKCWKCGSTNIKKKGYTRLGKQMYFCKNCQKKFVPIEKTRFLQKTEKQLIVKYHYHLGISVLELAKHLNRSTHTIYKFLEKYNTKRGEKQ